MKKKSGKIVFKIFIILILGHFRIIQKKKKKLMSKKFLSQTVFDKIVAAFSSLKLIFTNHIIQVEC